MRRMKMYLATYQTKPPDYGALTKRASEIGIKLEFGGGRKTKGGESPNSQIVLNLKEINSKVLVSRTGRVIMYYPSKRARARHKQPYNSRTFSPQDDARWFSQICILNAPYGYILWIVAPFCTSEGTSV
jgi:hypothetical protein